MFLIVVQQGDRRVAGIPLGRVDLRADCHFCDHLDDDDDDDDDNNDEEEKENENDDEMHVCICIYIYAFPSFFSRFSNSRETLLFCFFTFFSSLLRFTRSHARTPF